MSNHTTYSYDLLKVDTVNYYVSVIIMPEALCFRLSVRPSVRPKPEIYSFHLYMGPFVHPTNLDRYAACPSVRPSVCPSVRPERFPGICWRMLGGNDLKFCMQMYLGHFQKCLGYGHGLLIFQIFTLY